MKKKVLCFYCDKFLGWKKKDSETYLELKEGTIQEPKLQNNLV